MLAVFSFLCRHIRLCDDKHSAFLFYSSNTICCLFCPQISHSMCCCNFCNLTLPLTLLGTVSFLLWCYFFVVLCFDGCSVVVLSMLWSPIVLMSLFANAFLCIVRPFKSYLWLFFEIYRIKHYSEKILSWDTNSINIFMKLCGFINFFLENIPTILFNKYRFRLCKI